MQTQTIVKNPFLKHASEGGYKTVTSIQEVKNNQNSLLLDWFGWGTKPLKEQIDACLKKRQADEAKGTVEFIRPPAFYIKLSERGVLYMGFDPGTKPGWFSDAEVNYKWIPDNWVRIELS